MSESQRYQFGDVEVQPAAFSVMRDGKALDLEPKAVRVLLFLIQNRERAVGKDELIERVWEGTAVTDNALTRIVAQLRRELGDDARQARYIQTLPTLGYRFIAELQTAEARDGAGATAPKQPRKAVYILAAAVVAVILAAGLWLLLRRSAVISRGELDAVQLTTSQGVDIGASFNPDGRSFAYSSNKSGTFEIYVRAADSGGAERQLTADGKQNVDPVWSPDGKTIAYHSPAQHGIWLIPASGGTPRRLTEFGSAPAWSPDGGQIVFQATEPISLAFFDAGGASQSVLWTVAVDGSQLRQVTMLRNPPGIHTMPSWTVDGKGLVFVSLSVQSSIWTLDLATGKLDMLTQVGKDLPRRPGPWWTRLADPRPSPDGKGIYFSGVAGPRGYAIYFRRASGGPPVELYSTRSDVPSRIAVSPDGRRLLFTRFSNISQIWSVSPPAEPKPLFQEAVLRAYYPRYSPDGKRIGFLVETAGRDGDVWLMNADGSGAGPVTSDPGPKGQVGWSADGTGLLYQYVDGPRIEFRRYDPAAKTTRVLYTWPSMPQGYFHPFLLPDERQILTVYSTPFNLFVLPAQGGPLKQLTFERGIL